MNQCAYAHTIIVGRLRSFASLAEKCLGSYRARVVVVSAAAIAVMLNPLSRPNHGVVLVFERSGVGPISEHSDRSKTVSKAVNVTSRTAAWQC